jgi:hypothetical protein
MAEADILILNLSQSDDGSITVKLTPEDMKRIEQLAQERQRTEAVGDGTLDGRSWVDRWKDGLRGEFAAARFLGLAVREDSTCRDSGYDFRHRGLTLEVKYRQKWLAFSERQLRAFKADVAILANPGRCREEIILCGWVRRQAFLTGHFETNFGYGPAYCMKAENLRAMRELL